MSSLSKHSHTYTFNLPPTGYICWFPKYAVEVAHKVFGLKGKLKSFITYLSNPFRRKKMASIPLPVTTGINERGSIASARVSM